MTDSPNRPPRRHRIARIAATPTLCSALSLSGYLGSCGALQYYGARGAINRDLHNALNATVYAPIVWYCQSELPGGAAAKATVAWLGQRGAGSDLPLEAFLRPVFSGATADEPVVAPHPVTPVNPESRIPIPAS